MFKMSAFSFDARHETFAKAQNRFADGFIRWLIDRSGYLRSCFRIRWVLWFRF